MKHSSRLPGFYQKSLADRVSLVAEWASLDADEAAALAGSNGLNPEIADKLIENTIGVHGLPLGIATNFLVNGREVLVPMAIEEPSVVAGASFAARLIRAGGGFKTSSTSPEMIGQIQVLDVPDMVTATSAIEANHG